MDYFEAQERARRRTHVLIGLFVLSILGIVLVLYLPANAVAGSRPGGHDLPLFLNIALPVSGFILAGAWWRLRTLRAGGAAVATMMGARQVLPDTLSEAERRLQNVVEEMALASGVPVPAIFVLEGEEGINAFAAGYTIHDAAVVVTGGCLERLDRDELQGVIAHEFSHILNGDMRLNIRMVGMLYGLLLLTVVGRGIIRSSAHGRIRRSRDAGGALALGLGLLLVGYLGVLFGKLIKAAISRQREFLADAAAVQFTRNPGGLASALKKIAMLHPGSVIRDHHAEELSHVFFAGGLRRSWLSLSLLGTHPPIEERIRRVDRDWDGRYDVKVPEAMKEQAAEDRARRLSGEGVPAMARLGLPAAAVMASIGAPAAAHLSYARRLLEQIPETLRDSAHDDEGAQALVLALLLARAQGPVRERQMGLVAELGGEAMAREVEELSACVLAAGPEARLALLDLALPALRTLPEPRAAALRRTAQHLVREDGQVSMFEYTLVHVLARALQSSRQAQDRATEHIHSFQPLRDEVQLVLSAIAHSGAATSREADAAFSAAAQRLPPAAHPLTLQPAEAVDLVRVDRALQRLDRAAAPGVRRRLVDACAHAAAFDGQVLAEEAETLRAVAEALGCPMPPMAMAPVVVA